ncbi:hypothetical protein FAZ19_13135 [Sphingobacterium alkalisoli]|uniref:Uncharacterized protein n=1 Tax=Sphingobacterium alkalisoli TaxID=1874115 RepID=A0A4U0H6Q4_9SPHI|nr:hypothetical protein [Sphingobacterium alkalisoli]TJY66032.1 hypothetical protein FAZ19_13135 [Sphingobacterium alkalisoli]GGH16676.1 hypothetical protein GCM10011418_19190 [Sphingobacterium alkalisoli]
MDKSENRQNANSWHIGEVIRNLVKEKEITTDVLAAYLEISDEGLEEIYQSHSIDIKKLIKISELLNYNLFIYYLDNKIIGDLFENQMNVLDPQIKNLILNLETKNEELARLKILTEAQRKVIELYETKAYLHTDNQKK